MTSLFIESEPYHEETLLPLVYEKSEAESDLVCSAIPKTGGDIISMIDRDWVNYSFIKALLLIIKTPNLKYVYFNTLESMSCFILVLISRLFGIKVRAIAHNVDMFYPQNQECNHGVKISSLGIFSRWLMRPLVEKFYVLSTEVLEHHSCYSKKLELLSTKSLSMMSRQNLKELHDPSCYYVGVLGDVAYGRRNYDYFFDFDEDSLRAKNVRFVFLGNVTQIDGDHFREQVARAEKSEEFIFFERYLSYAEFFGGISQCEELISIPRSNRYGLVKTSATTHLAKSFGKKVTVWNNADQSREWLHHLNKA